MRAGRLALFGAVLLLAFVAYGVRAGDLRREGRQVGSDAESQYRLRLVELTLASERAPRHDRFLLPPNGSSVPWPPLYHASLARLARARLSRAGGDPTLRGVDPAALRLWLLPASPLGFAVAVLLLAAAASAFVGAHGARARASAALCAALLAALHPAAVELGLAERVAADGWALALGAAVLFAATGALRPGDPIDGLAFALGGGLLAGLGALLSPATLGVSVGVVVALFVVAIGSNAARASDARRSGLLYCATAGVVCGLARFGLAPALAKDDATSAEAWLSPLFLLLAGPLLLSGLSSGGGRALPRARTQTARVPGGAVAVLSMALFAAAAGPLGIVDGLRAATVRWASSGWPAVQELPGGVATLVGLAALPVAVAGAWNRLDAPGRALLVFIALFGGVEALGPGPGPAFLLAMAAAVSCALALGAPATRAAAGLFVAGVLVPSVLASFGRVLPAAAGPASAEGAAESQARARACEWLRESEPRPVAWNNARTIPTGAVLAPPDWDGWIAGAARRPVLASRLVAGCENSAWSSVLGPRPEALLSALDAHGARHVLIPAAASICAADGSGNAARLLHGEPFAGLARVWASEEHVPCGGDASHADVPVVAIWRRTSTD